MMEIFIAIHYQIKINMIVKSIIVIFSPQSGVNINKTLIKMQSTMIGLLLTES